MLGPTSLVAPAKASDVPRLARDHYRLRIHARQRTLVLASVLLSARADRPTHRRSPRIED